MPKESGDPHTPVNLRERKFIHFWMRTRDTAKAYYHAYGRQGEVSEQRARTAGQSMLRRANVRRFIRLMNLEIDERLSRGSPPPRDQQIKPLTEPGLPALPPIQEDVGPKLKHYVASLAADKAWIADRLAALGNVSVRDYMSWGPNGMKIKNSEGLTEAQAYGILSVSMTTSRTGSKTVTLKFADKEKALVDLAKLNGYLRADDDEVVPTADSEGRRERAKRSLLKALEALAKPEPLTIEGEAEPDPAPTPAVEPKAGSGV